MFQVRSNSMGDPYQTCFANDAKQGLNLITQQELVTYVWKGNHLLKITTTRKFSDDDYIDSQTSEVIYIE